MAATLDSNDDAAVVVLRSVDSAGRAVRAEIAVARGGRVRQLRIGAHALLRGVADDAATAHSSGWGAFPMAPWCGRLAHGRLGAQQLALNFDDGGTGGGGGRRRRVGVGGGEDGV